MFPTRNRKQITQRSPRFTTGILRALVASLAHCSGFARGAAPTLDHLFPVAVQSGTTQAVTFVGQFEPWPVKAWADTPGLRLQPEKSTGKFRVEVAADVPAGPHLVRVFNDAGASGPRFLIVTREPQLAETEPNDEFTKPQVLSQFPVALNGCLEKSGDVDSFAVGLEAGQTLVASLEAYTLASPLDAVLRLVDAFGVQVALNHDDGRTLDPLLAWTAVTAGRYVLQVFGFAYPAGSDLRFTGNSKCVYRLHVSRGPWLRYTVPLGVRRGGRTVLHPSGWNLGQKLGAAQEFDGTSLAPPATDAFVRLAGFENTLTLPIGDGPELTERELAPLTNGVIQLHPPCAITGCLEKPGEADRFSFAAKKGVKLLLAVQSAAFGFPLDPAIKVEDAHGKELAKSDDGSNADPNLEWTPPEDGTFFARVSNVLHRGDAEHLYRLSLRPATPGWKATVAANAFVFKAGETNEIKVSVKRLHGFKSKLALSAQGLPEGVQSSPAEVPADGGDVSLRLIVAPEAKAFNGPIQIILQPEPGEPRAALFEMVTSGVDNGVPNGFTHLVIESTDVLWLTVPPKDPKKS